MSRLVHQLPPLDLKLRTHYLFDRKPEDYPEYLDCQLVSVKTIVGRALEFQVLTEQGFVRDKLPITALCTQPCDELTLDYCQRWNCQAYDGIVYASPILFDCDVITLRDSQHGDYLFTVDLQHMDDAAIDYTDSQLPQEHKCMHVIALHSGQLIAYPNNSLLFKHPTKTRELLTSNPGFTVCQDVWAVNEHNETVAAQQSDWQYDWDGAL